jgi:3-methyladenine DNA glycosylase AlkD
MSQEWFSSPIERLQAQLQDQAVPETKEWWEGYMKHVIPFRGVKMPVIRSVLHRWYKAERLATTLSLPQQKELALKLFQGGFTEDKLAGILFLQEILLPAGAIDCREDLPRFSALFTENWIYDWNVCDWFCVKVLGPLIRAEGDACAAAISVWHQAENLWQARCSVVAFVPEASNPAYYPLVEASCRVLIRREERFAKTAVGWILREIANHDEPLVKAFLDNNLGHFSLESLRNATKYLAKPEQTGFIQRFKSLGASTDS